MSKHKFLFLLSFCTFASCMADPVCHKCEMIREANKHRTDNYEFFDDYVKEHPNAKPVHEQEQQGPQDAQKQKAQEGT